MPEYIYETITKFTHPVDYHHYDGCYFFHFNKIGAILSNFYVQGKYILSNIPIYISLSDQALFAKTFYRISIVIALHAGLKVELAVFPGNNSRHMPL